MEIPDLASVDLALTTTRSVRRRIDWERPVPREVIERCIDIATQAPTGLDLEAWRFVVVTEPDRKRRLADVYRRAFARLADLRAEHAARSGAEPPAMRPVVREAASLLGIPDDVTQTVLLPIGYMRDAKLAPAKRKPAREVTYWEAWGRDPEP